VTDLQHRVGKLDAKDLAALAGHRGLAGWSLCPDGTGGYWLKVPAGDEEVFRTLPLLGRWTADAAGKLVREGHRVAEALLPAAGWQALASYLPLSPPFRGAPGMPPPAVAFRLVPDHAGHPAAALLGRLDAFAAWTETAFAPRLERLRFACCEDGRAFIEGTPLPPLPGTGYHRHGRLWLPCGWRLPDHAWPELLEEVLGLGRNRMSLLHPDGGHEDLDEENLVPAARAAVRSTTIA
jgi:hypothetical protein